jgi:KaiC/GvpD/RAD55 family RecA-like ATPase
MNDFIKVSPLKLLEMSSGDGLGKGNLGVLIARAGVGKTACLIHIAFDMLFRKQRLVHVSLEDTPEKVTSYYNVIFSDLVKALEIKDETESRMLLERNRMILAYLNKSFEINRLRGNLKNLKEQIDFIPDILIVDGLNFEKVDTETMEDFKKVAEEFDVEIWFSALSHRHITEKNEKGIPYPCSRVDDYLSVIIQLDPGESGIFLKLIKDHDHEVKDDSSIRLDPNTFLATI